MSLLPAVFENRVDSLELWAATGTEVFRPSAYLISARSAVRLDQVTYFDFIYDITPEGEHVLIPLAALASTGRTTGNPGILPTAVPFDSITIAEQTGYVTADTIHIRVGDVFFARSAPAPTCILSIPSYAKLQVLAMSDSARAISIRILSNINCGYRGLEIGLPKR
ncbi:MAG TPA: hypothetical protein VJK71_04795 [Gemmatimonadales bacterium]|nr:hypothetical protein [Gemmatimonadales bacterium]